MKAIVTLQKRALEWYRYSQSGWFSRLATDITWDLRYNDTIKSKLAWAALAVILSGLLTKVLSLLGWI